MKTIGQYRKLDFLDDYYVLDVVSFIEGKTFRIENVRHDKVNGQPCVKIDTRIVSDNNTKKDFNGSALKKNEGKVVTFQVVEDNPEILELTKTQLLDTVGHKLIISSDNIKGYYTYRGSCLIIHINDFKENLFFSEIKSLKIYNRALTDQEIQQNYQLEKERWGL